MGRADRACVATTAGGCVRALAEERRLSHVRLRAPEGDSRTLQWTSRSRGAESSAASSPSRPTVEPEISRCRTARRSTKAIRR